jgi:hypothetical protein
MRNERGTKTIGMKTKHRVICNERLRSLRPILNGWVRLQKDYIHKVKNDLPWWYLERPQIGFLAGAVWRAKGIALEEWATKKGEKRHKTKNGRNDLWLQHEGREWYIEAKYIRCELRKGDSNCAQKIKKHLDSAKVDVLKVHSPELQQLAVVFAAAQWRGSAKEFAEAVKLWKRICVPERSESDAVAVVTAKRCSPRLKLYTTEKLIGLSVFIRLVN